MASAVQILAAIGVFLLIPPVYRFLSFLWLYLRPSTVQKYLHGSPPAYALVTGATDGIGRAVARELYDKGFNLILHGRNEDKMRRVAEEIRSRGARDVLYFLADASDRSVDFSRVLEPFKNLKITLVFHNVGGQAWTSERIDGLGEEHLHGIVQRNDMFPLLLTRALLPQLRATAKAGPVLVQFVGSMAGEISPVRFAPYAASKLFLKALVRGLSNDEHYWDGPTGVEFEYLMVGQVQSNSVRCDASWGSPSSETFARATVSRMGCGRRAYAPYMPHAVMLWAMELLGEGAVDNFTAQSMVEMIAAQEKKA